MRDFFPLLKTNAGGSEYASADTAPNAVQTVEAGDSSFGLSETSYKNIELLGVQQKISSGTNNIRCIAVINEGIISDALDQDGTIADYGFVVAKCSSTTTASAGESNISTAEKGVSGTYFASCKGTSNNLCGDYGVCNDSSTKYKYVTMTISDVSASQGFVIRFCIVTKSGRVYYANYGDDYTGCVTNYSGLSSTVQ